MNTSETEPEVIGYLLHDSVNSNDDFKTDMVNEGLTDSDGSSIRISAVSLSDGTTALVHHGDTLQLTNAEPSYQTIHTKIGKHNEEGDDGMHSQFIDGQMVKLEDGTTAYIQSSGKDDEMQSQFIKGQMVELEDGTTAYIQSSCKGLQAVQLEDGTTAYISRTLHMDYDLGTHSVEDLGSDLGKTDLNRIDVNQNTPLVGINCVLPQQGRSAKAMALGDKAFRCLFLGCGRHYTSQHHLKVHERSHSGDRPFKCDTQGCPKAFATGYGLKSHTRVHTGEKPYKCTEEYCDKAFKTSGDLQKHVRTHTGEKPFKCPFEGCDRSFTTSNIRKVHVRTHTGERPYLCPEDGCGRSFASATNFKNHVRIHTGEKPYVCTVHGCGKRFTEYSSLYKHHVVHTHSKPYICYLCKKNYRQTSTLAAHKRNAHGIVESGDEEMSLQVPGEDIEDEHSQDDNGKDHQRIQLMVASSDVNDPTTLVELQAAQQAIQQVHDHQKAQLELSVASRNGPQILVVTDPAQFAALQQLSQQLTLAAQGLDGSKTVTLSNADTLATSPNGSLLTVASEVFLSKRGDKLNMC